MRYELEIYNTELGSKAEKVTIDNATGFSVTDGVEGSLFTVVGARGAPLFVVPMGRLRSMRAVVEKKQARAKQVRSVSRIS